MTIVWKNFRFKYQRKTNKQKNKKIKINNNMTTFTTSSVTGSNQFLQSYVRQVQVALDEYGRYEYYTMVTCSHENKTGKGKEIGRAHV